jgi:hypothetical protein
MTTLNGGMVKSMVNFSTEQLTERWESHNEITNLVGRLGFLEILRNTDMILSKYWCDESSTPSLGLQDGYYKGRAAIEEYYRAIKEIDMLKAETAKELHPNEFANKSASDMRGVGSLHALNFTTPVLELAEDGKTAKGLWYMVAGLVDFYSSEGPSAKNIWGRVGIDFIKERNGWKLWHVVFAIDIHAPMGAGWVAPSSAPNVPKEYARIAAHTFPKPNIAKKIYSPYSSERRPICFPKVPDPYATFAETFSYGAE